MDVGPSLKASIPYKNKVLINSTILNPVIIIIKKGERIAFRTKDLLDILKIFNYIIRFYWFYILVLLLFLKENLLSKSLSLNNINERVNDWMNE